MPRETDTPTVEAEDLPDANDQPATSGAGTGDDFAGMLAAAEEIAPSDPDADRLDLGGDAGPLLPAEDGDTPAPDGSEADDDDGSDDALDGGGDDGDDDEEDHGDEDPDADEADGGDEDEGQDDADGDELPDEPSQRELAGYRPRTRRRIEQLLDERNELREQVQVVSDLQKYLSDNNVTGKDFDYLLGLTAALGRGDWGTFLQSVTPFVQHAQAQLGLVLPPDLRAKVEEGIISDELARELAVSRAQAQRQQQDARRERARAESATNEARAQAIEYAVDDWVHRTRVNDPDFARKEPLIQRFTEALVARQGLPRTPQEALSLARQAYDEASDALSSVVRQAVQSRRGTRPRPNGSVTPPQMRPEPRTIEEAALIGLERAQRG